MDLLTKTYTKALYIFVGDSERFSLEHRVFNLLSVFICFDAIASLFLNLALGLYESAVLSVIICLVQSGILYLSRVEKKFNTAVILTGVELHLLLGTNYFLNHGINGPTIVFFLVALFILATVANKKSVWFWLTINIFLLAVLFGIEYHYPQTIIVSYEDKFAFFNDMYITYIFVGSLMTAGIFYTRAAFEKQRKDLESKALALQNLNAQKTKLFSIVAHDLRAPMGTVKQYLDFLKEDDLEEEEKTIIETGLVKSVNEAYDLLDNLLVWAKSQMSGTNPLLKPLRVKETLADVVNQTRSYAQNKNISIIDDIEDLEVLADENMLKLVIRNLLFNAIKFSYINEQVQLSVFKEGGRVIFKTKDNGLGISVENQKKIFSLEVRVNVGTRKEKGTGLGLLLCKEYTQLQNGEIWFESEIGKGSTFYIALPFHN